MEYKQNFYDLWYTDYGKQDASRQVENTLGILKTESRGKETICIASNNLFPFPKLIDYFASQPVNYSLHQQFTTTNLPHWCKPGCVW